MRTIASWNEDEEEALQGLPWLAQLVYLRALKPFMDYATGLVGLRRGVSRQSIMEAVEVPEVQGRHSEYTQRPSLKAISKALETLEGAGLLERRGSDKLLIFNMPLARRDESEQNMRGRSGADEGKRMRGSATPSHLHGLPTHEGECPSCPPHADEGDTSVIRYPLLNTQHLSSKSATVVNPSVKLAKKPPRDEEPSSAGTESRAEQVRQVFAHWQAVMHKPRAKLDAKRSRLISLRLQEGFGMGELLRAIEGCKASPFHQGLNPKRKRYDDLELILRHAGKVEQFIEYADQEAREQVALDEFVYGPQAIAGECKRC